MPLLSHLMRILLLTILVPISFQVSASPTKHLPAEHLSSKRDPKHPRPSPLKRPHSTCKNPLIRKEWRSLSTSEKLSYISAVQCLGDKRRSKSISGIPGLQTRYDDFQGVHSVQTPFIHWVGFFILWHRYFIATYEKTLRELCGYKGAQPYWDWTIDNASNKDMANWPVFDNHTGFGGNGPYLDGPNPFSIPERSGGGCVPKGPFTWPKWSVGLGPGSSLEYRPHCLSRDFSRPLMAWATSDLVHWVQDVDKYEDFAFRLENVPIFTIPNVHGAGHFGVGGALGAMGDVYGSPGDPLFYLHHSSLDRLLWKWQQRNLPARYYDVGGPIIPFDYQNVQGPNITLSFQVGLGKLAPNVTLAKIMDLQGEVLCYDYDYNSCE
ncbi:Tyrosinase [Arthrobotrys entomopaga]|nr:Tyrosinase [Arthrobotrys entomopaga]